MELKHIIGSYPVFSPDSKHLGYVAASGTINRWGHAEVDYYFPVIDGKEGKRHKEKILEEGLVFSPNGEVVAYVAKEFNAQFVVLDGKEHKKYNSIGSKLIFSSDSKRLAYVAEDSGKQFFVVDGKEGKGYSAYPGIDAENLVFSHDGKRFAFVVVNPGSKYVVVSDGKEEERKRVFPETLTFSPDGKHIAYVAEHDVAESDLSGIDVELAEKTGSRLLQSVVVDGKIGKCYFGILGKVIFDSPDVIYYLAHNVTRAGEYYYIVEEKIN